MTQIASIADQIQVIKLKNDSNCKHFWPNPNEEDSEKWLTLSNCKQADKLQVKEIIKNDSNHEWLIGTADQIQVKKTMKNDSSCKRLLTKRMSPWLTISAYD